MEETPILKNCPFCNSTAKYMIKEYSPTCKEVYEVYDIQCTNKECYLSEGAEWEIDTKKEVAEMWNNGTKSK